MNAGTTLYVDPARKHLDGVTNVYVRAYDDTADDWTRCWVDADVLTLTDESFARWLATTNAASVAKLLADELRIREGRP